MLNRVTLIGRLTADPEFRYTPQGTPVARFTLAVNRPFTNQQGEREADFIDIVVWRQLAENVANYVRKGRLVAVEGRLQTRSYENKEGRRIRVVEVVGSFVEFLSSPNGGQKKDNADSSNDEAFYDENFLGLGPGGKPLIDEDDLPF
jgi:single stranded DNA-binding protein (ssb)